jgi:GrpB-like predicted nucleotidyltransferase (UPF0157 family)
VLIIEEDGVLKINKSNVLFLFMKLDDKVKIIEPSEEIFQIVEFYKNIVKKALPDAKVTLIGSLAIPMCGKEEFDLLVEVDGLDLSKAQSLISENSENIIGIGPITNEGEAFSRSKKRYGIICELHILPKGHKKIFQYLDLVNRLKSDKEIVRKYEGLKRSLDGFSEEEYRNAKIKFLEESGLI